MKTAIEFFNVKTKQKFTSSDYIIREKGGRFFAVAKPEGAKYECWRIISKSKAQELKEQ